MAWEHVCIQAVPDQHDRCLEELVGAVDECDEVTLAHAATFAFARSVGAQAVAQPGAGTGLHRDQPGYRQAFRASPPDRHDRGAAAPAPGASPGRPAVKPALVLETDVSPVGRPGSFTSAQVASFQTVTACSSRSATPPCGDLRSEAEPVHQPRGTRDAVRDVELPADQRGHPRRRPHLVLPRPVRGRTLLEIPGELLQRSAATDGNATRSTTGGAEPEHRRPATADATGRPISGSPQAPCHLRRLDLLLEQLGRLHPHRLPAPTSRSGQPAPIPHTSHTTGYSPRFGSIRAFVKIHPDELKSVIAPGVSDAGGGGRCARSR